jgi:protein-S-isoprenylcysteine O-methyltransferase Ste14
MSETDNKTIRYQMQRKDNVIMIYMAIGVVIQILSAFFCFNWFGYDIIVFLGFICFLISIILFLSSNILREKGGMEQGGSFETTKLVDFGIYSVIRHPIYLSLAYFFIGLTLISLHPVSIFFGITITLMWYYFMIEEEKMTAEKFGEEYSKYMIRVPRSNLLIGLWRFLRRKED